MSAPTFRPGAFDAPAFLRDHWQRAPLLIRDPWADWANPLDPDELAGLACEDDVDSRLIEQNSDAWRLEHGPLPENRFGALGKAPWTLLVQSVDSFVPDVAALLDAFRFLPNWRIDDVMVSYATDGGGVGPHFDQYDVFLIQGLGQRRWRIGGGCDANTPLLPHDDLRLLAEFRPTDEWLLGPGDILYLPPGIAHDGVAASDDCMTYSVGFRAPSRAELISGFADHLLAEFADADRYGDPGLPAQANPGEIAPAALARLHAMVTEAVTDPALFARWFGTFGTTPKHAPEPPEAGATGAPLRRNPASRFAFIRQGDAATLFADGQDFDTTAAFAEHICAADVIRPATEADRALADALYDQGSLTN